MVLVLAAPMFAEVSIGGEFDYYMVNGFTKVDDPAEKDEGHSFVDNWDKGEVDFKATVGDYSTVKIELEEDGEWNKGDGTYPKGTPSFNYFRVVTDWGKFFGLDGIGITTDIGLNSWETFDNVDFTGFNYENADSSLWIEDPATSKDFGAKISLSFVDGLVQPYFAWTFDTVTYKDGWEEEGVVMGDKNFEFLVGSGFDFNAMGLPLWLEAYYFDTDMEDINMFGVEAMYDLAIGDMNFKLGGYYANATNGDDRGSAWGFGVGFEAFGAAINVSTGGTFGEDYWDAAYNGDGMAAFSVLGVDAEYFFLDWLGVNAGVGFAFGDYAEFQCGDKTFQTFEAGVVVKPDKGVCYKLGYIYADEDTTEGKMLGVRTLNTKKLAADKGGLYFVTKIDF